MRKIVLFIVVVFVSCVPEEIKRACFSIENQTIHFVQVEFWNYNSGQAVTQEHLFSKNGLGVFGELCKEQRRLAGASEVYRGDSIVVKFNNNRKLTYLAKLNNTLDPIFFYDFFKRLEGSNNFIYEITDEDFDNAIPY